MLSFSPFSSEQNPICWESSTESSLLRLLVVRGMTQVARKDWWESFYEQHTENREWFVSIELACDILVEEAKRMVQAGKRAEAKREEEEEEQKGNLTLLQIGCGTSDLHLLAMESGLFERIVNIDYAEPLTKILKEKATKCISFEHMDARNMSFKTGQFDCVIDKGTFDCVVLSKNAEEDSKQFCSEVARVLKPGGVFVVISIHEPESRLKFLDRTEYHWKCETRILDLAPYEVPEQQNTFVYIMRKAAAKSLS